MPQLGGRRHHDPPLQNRLVLHQFVCREFGYGDLETMLGRLREAPVDPASGEHNYAAVLSVYLTGGARVTPDLLSKYATNIAAHSERLRMTGEHGRTWKPHQYVALLFTEHYLNRYFADPAALCADLDHERERDRLTAAMPEYRPDDLRTVAFQSATGSGKTLLMHANILQYRHYLDLAGGRLNNVVLVTPNEQMSVQHEREMRESGLHARLFSRDAQSELFAPVEIIDLNKLAKRQGVKRVAVGDFGDDNLVLVDEGHLGATGRVWRERRRELSRGGFTFEYSATFNQVVSGRDPDLLHAYGKCLLFDYSYRRFHQDGYGKDYAILNLPGGAEDVGSDMYLLGCLLTFYQQCRIWRERGAQYRAFNPAKPLQVFLGKTVTGSSQADQATRSDVALILNFLGWVLAQGEMVQTMIEHLLAGGSGLRDETGNDYFAGRFHHLPRSGAAVYADLCKTVFHGRGRLHVVYLTAGEGELHLRTADNAPFGVVNVGDSAALYKLLSETDAGNFEVDREMGFAERLFSAVDRLDSTVNVVIGARRFIAGWNSWRVSTMGLMHVGVGEGPEIIQMFGRGVRLKGWNMSLKRYSAAGAEPPADSTGLLELERLYIFGLRANYMRTFRDLLKQEGISTEDQIFRLPVTWNFARRADLKLIRLREDQQFDHSDERPILPEPAEARLPIVTLDQFSRLQTVTSGEEGTSAAAGRDTVSLSKYTAMFDFGRVYHRLLRRKRQRGWRNLVIERSTVQRLLARDDWYQLTLPAERFDIVRFGDVRRLEDIAVDLLTDYADRYWRARRRRWEHGRIEVITLDRDDPNNIGAYEMTVDAARKQLVQEATELKTALSEGGLDDLKPWYEGLKIGTVALPVHAYWPLLHTRNERAVTVQPVPLDPNEKRVVEQMAGLAMGGDPSLRGRELFLIRNETRGRGVSFFDDFGYYPDFIAWLKDDSGQHVLFLDPKGLGRFGGRERRKVQLHRDIAHVERQVRRTDPDLRLHAYILSTTPAAQIDDGTRSTTAWKKDGVYFLNEYDCMKQVIEHALQRGLAQQ